MDGQAGQGGGDPVRYPATNCIFSKLFYPDSNFKRLARSSRIIMTRTSTATFLPLLFLLLLPGFVSSPLAGCRKTVHGRIVAYRPFDRWWQVASHVTSEELYLVKVEKPGQKCKPSFVIVSYLHYGDSLITDETLRGARLLRLTLHPHPGGNQTYDQSRAASQDRNWGEPPFAGSLSTPIMREACRPATPAEMLPADGRRHLGERRENRPCSHFRKMRNRRFGQGKVIVPSEGSPSGKSPRSGRGNPAGRSRRDRGGARRAAEVWDGTGIPMIPLSLCALAPLR